MTTCPYRKLAFYVSLFVKPCRNTAQIPHALNTWRSLLSGHLSCGTVPYCLASCSDLLQYVVEVCHVVRGTDCGRNGETLAWCVWKGIVLGLACMRSANMRRRSRVECCSAVRKCSARVEQLRLIARNDGALLFGTCTRSCNIVNIVK